MSKRIVVGVFMPEDLDKFFIGLAEDNNCTKSRVIEAILKLFKDEYIRYNEDHIYQSSKEIN